MVIPVGITIIGAVIGSFLNVVIYRLPLGISLNSPKRSFCPSCQRQLSWFENIPVISWIVLRGRCRGCRAAILFRYPLVELITAALFLFSYLHFGWPLVMPAALFVSLLIVATFIDLEHLIIPDVITLGGVVAGMSCSIILPAMMGTDSRGMAFLISAGSAAAGYGLLWCVVELGKIAFGKRCLKFETAQGFELSGEIPTLHFGQEIIPLEELLFRSSDKIFIQAASLEIAGEQFSDQKIMIDRNGISIDSRKWSLNKDLILMADIMEITLPREAMGLGDVKFLACIGAFLGWKGMIFSLFAGSIIGAILGSLLLIVTQGRKGRCVPFGPYLAGGALIWIFFGLELLSKWPRYSF